MVPHHVRRLSWLLYWRKDNSRKRYVRHWFTVHINNFFNTQQVSRGRRPERRASTLRRLMRRWAPSAGLILIHLSTTNSYMPQTACDCPHPLALTPLIGRVGISTMAIFLNETWRKSHFLYAHYSLKIYSNQGQFHEGTVLADVAARIHAVSQSTMLRTNRLSRIVSADVYGTFSECQVEAELVGNMTRIVLLANVCKCSFKQHGRGLPPVEYCHQICDKCYLRSGWVKMQRPMEPQRWVIC